MQKLLRILVILGFGFIINPIFADDRTDGLTFQHCPFTDQFQAVVIRPAGDQYLLRCLDGTGSTYYSELGDESVDQDDPDWLHNPYPVSDLCMGHEPEDCKFYNE